MRSRIGLCLGGLLLAGAAVLPATRIDVGADRQGPPGLAAQLHGKGRIDGVRDTRGRDRGEDREGRRGDVADRDSPTNARGALHQRYLQRVAGRDSIPIDGLVRAKEQIERMRDRDDDLDAGLWTWTWLGPGNIGGRIRAILPSPNVANRLFIGSASGGIWRSDNAGASWTPVNDFMANLAVTSIVADPTNGNVMYASTGEGFGNIDALPGGGIFKSVDGGATWNQQEASNNIFFYYVNRLAHHPTASGTLFAACWSGILMRTTDGGGNWFINSVYYSNVTDVKFQPSNGNRILIGTAPDQDTPAGEVYLTTDGGANWAEQTTGAANKLPDDGGRYEIAWGPGNVVYAVTDRSNGQIYRSTDGGGTWALRSTTNFFNAGSGSQGWYDNAVWVDPTNSNFVVVGGIDLYRSTDGGASFTKISDWNDYHTGTSAHADQHTIVPHPGYDGNTNRRVYFGNDGGIQTAANVANVSQNSGWTNLANGLGITQFYHGAAAPDGSVIIGGTQDNDVLRIESGQGTGQWYQAETGDGGYCAVDFTNSSNLYGEYAYLQVEKSTNGGDSYVNSYTGLGDAAAGLSLFIAPFVMDPTDASRLIGGGYRLWRTTNGAASWSQLRGAITGNYYCSALGIKAGNGNEIWAGYTDGTVSVSTNGGSGWSNVDGGSPGLPDRWTTDIAVSPHYANEAIVTFAGYNSDNVWATVDRGATWLRRTGSSPDTLPALQVNCVAYHPVNPDWIYIGTDLGIFASHDFGATWNVAPRYGDNEGPANVEVDELFWHGEYLITATHGRGMYRSRPLEVVYVDAANAGQEDGSLLHPYNTVREGIAASGNDTDLSIKAGTYTEGPNLFNRAGVVTASGGTVVVK